MRLACPEQRLDCLPISEVTLNLNCRDEIIPILRALQHLYGNAAVAARTADSGGQGCQPEAPAANMADAA